jgi:hypothetical protein
MKFPKSKARSAHATARHLTSRQCVPHAVVSTNDGVLKVVPMLMQTTDALVDAAMSILALDVSSGVATIEHIYTA